MSEASASICQNKEVPLNGSGEGSPHAETCAAQNLVSEKNYPSESCDNLDIKESLSKASNVTPVCSLSFDDFFGLKSVPVSDALLGEKDVNDRENITDSPGYSRTISFTSEGSESESPQTDNSSDISSDVYESEFDVTDDLLVENNCETENKNSTESINEINNDSNLSRNYNLALESTPNLGNADEENLSKETENPYNEGRDLMSKDVKQSCDESTKANDFMRIILCTQIGSETLQQSAKETDDYSFSEISFIDEVQNVDVQNAISNAIKDFHGNIDSVESIVKTLASKEEKSEHFHFTSVISRGSSNGHSQNGLSVQICNTDDNCNSKSLNESVSDSFYDTSDDSLVKVDNVTSEDVTTSFENIQQIDVQNADNGKQVRKTKVSDAIKNSQKMQRNFSPLSRNKQNHLKKRTPKATGKLKLPHINNKKGAVQLVSSGTHQSDAILRRPKTVNSDSTELNSSPTSFSDHRQVHHKKICNEYDYEARGSPKARYHVPRFLKAHALYKNGQLEVTVTDEHKSLPENEQISIKLTVVHKHVKKLKIRKLAYPKFSFVANRDIIRQRAMHPPMNTLIDEEASRRFRKMYGL